MRIPVQHRPPMPVYDESAIRKAATWQHFKEAQSLLKLGHVLISEKTSDGWKGAIKAGAKTYRVTVVARTPTWLDAHCPCPISRREGAFCPHAIAVGLHLSGPPSPQSLSHPPESKPTPQTSFGQIPDYAPAGLPEIAWAVRFQGPWERSLRSHRASILVSSSSENHREPGPADSRITSWLLKNAAGSSSTIQLSLDSRTLPSFLAAIEDHPAITTADGPLECSSGATIHLSDCRPSAENIILTPSPQVILSMDDRTFTWEILPTSIRNISNSDTPANIRSILKTLSSGQQATVSLPLFLETLPLLQNHLDFSASPWFQNLQFRSIPPDLELILNGSSRRLTAQLLPSYSQALPALHSSTVFTPDPSIFQKALLNLSSHFPHSPSGELVLTQPDSIRDFLTRIVPTFSSTWKVSMSPAIATLASSYVVISPHLTLDSPSDHNQSFHLTFRTDDGTVVSPAEIRSLLRSSPPTSPALRNKQIVLSDSISGLIYPLFEDLDLLQDNGRFTASGASAEIIREISKSLGNPGLQPGKGTSPELIHIPTLRADLRPYQQTGVNWLVDRLSGYGGALLADDMGLGKTVQAIASLEHFFASCSQPSPAIVIATTSLLGNWAAELERFAPDRKVVTLHGPHRDKLRSEITPQTVILTTYATLSRDLAYHLSQKYSLAIIDEASLIRNPDTDLSKAVARLNAIRRIALTGTPVENSARDLWSIFRFVQPGWLGTRTAFRDRYELPLKDPATASQASTLLRLKTSPFTLRRTKSEVAPELPSKILIDEFCTLSTEQLATYHDLQRQGIIEIEDTAASGRKAAARMMTLTTLLRLRQACCDLALLGSEKLAKLPIPKRSAKLERLLEIASQTIPAGSRILVFSQFQKQLLEIGAALHAGGIPSLRLDGQTRDRHSLVNRFQSPDGPPVFLISLKAGGYGLNLTAADIVVHFDPWWNPAAETQATDRAHRIGQTKPVTVFRLLTRNTVEEKVVALQASKQALADSLDESATPTDAPAWSESELRSLLS